MKRKILSVVLAMSFVLTACGQDAAPAANSTTTAPETKVEATATVAPADETTIEEEPVVEETEPIVYFRAKSGFYDKLDLELFCPIEGSKIYYTTDGTIPTEASLVYEGPIALKDRTPEKEVYAARTDYCTDSQYVPGDRIVKANIIRAVAVFADGTSSIVTNGTYIIGQNREKLYGDCPVVSLITDPENLFNDETGIFILGKSYRDWIAEDASRKDEPSYRAFGNFSNKGKDWERPVAFEYIPADGKNVSADMGLRMKGASTRTYLQKSMKLIAREEYGTKNIKAELIPGNMKSDGSEVISKYKTFVLRNGGNDNGFGKMRDPFIQTMVSDRNMETQQSTPVAVFLDGEYWGCYALTEDYTDNYIQTNYGVEKENVVIVKCGEIEEGQDEDIALYQDLYSFITENDMSIDANYAKACEMLDMPSLIDFVALTFYIYNHDSLFDDNNWSLWRVREADNATAVSDGKWRVLLYDTEFSSGVYSGGKEYDVDNITGNLATMRDTTKTYDCEYPLVHIVNSLYDNTDFQNDIIATMMDMRNYNFNRDKIKATMADMSPAYQTLAPASFYRYGPDWVVFSKPEKYYEQKLTELKTFFNGRYTVLPSLMTRIFDVNDTAAVEITTTDTSAGEIWINNTKLDLSDWKDSTYYGDYFTDCYITVTAVPAEGKTFAGWEIKGADSVTDASALSTRVKFSGKCSIKAMFK